MHIKRLYIIILTKYEIFPTLNFLYTKIMAIYQKKRKDTENPHFGVPYI